MDIIGDGVLRLHQIQQFPQVKLTRDENENCSICIGDFNKNEIILILPCVHKFHSNCIKTWLSENNTCPTCRGTVIESNGIENATLSSSTDDEDVDITDIAFPSLPTMNHSAFSILNSIANSPEASSSSSLETADEEISISSYDIDSDSLGSGSTESLHSNSTADEINSQSSDSSNMFFDSSSESDDATDVSFATGLNLSSNSNSIFNLNSTDGNSTDGSDNSFFQSNDTFSDYSSD